MRASWSPIPKQTPRAAFRKLVACEARLAWRQPTGLIFGLGLPLLLLVIYCSIPALNKPAKEFGGLSYFNTQIPVLIALVIAVLAFVSLPAPLATYRNQGILRRLSTTPVPPSWVLAAQLLVNLCLRPWPSSSGRQVLQMGVREVAGLAERATTAACSFSAGVPATMSPATLTRLASSLSAPMRALFSASSSSRMTSGRSGLLNCSATRPALKTSRPSAR